MSPSLITACRRARAASAFYVVAWVAFVVVFVAAVAAVLAFPALLPDRQQQQEAFFGLALLGMVPLLLPFVADAVLSLALTALPGAAGQLPLHPLPRFLLFVSALLVPLLAITASMSAARRATEAVPHAPTLPGAWSTLYLPILLAFVGSGLAVVAMGIQGTNESAPLILLMYPVVGLGRVHLGRALYCAFGELLSRPAVDELHAHGVEPVAGG